MYLLNTQPELNVSDIKSLKAETYPFDHINHGDWFISIEFKNPTDFEEITRNNIGQFLAITIDNKVLMAPRINQIISQGSAQIPSLTMREAIMIENKFNNIK